MRLPLLLLPALWLALPVRADSWVALDPPRAVMQQVINLVNDARAQGRRCGGENYPPAAPLELVGALRRAAQRHADDMAQRGYFNHRAPDGSTPKHRVQSAGYRPRLTGENIAFGPESAREVVAGWLASPGHCANIMDARFSDTGLGLALGARRGHIYWVQTFGSPTLR